ncbi:MAG: nicotinate-nucleotide adenylyltransferase [Acidobacteriaceae bacterium]|jgi:nicotinate-nucleotide adenylyltransferase|nr:nicotinate-nucleotide adenylyltransferase [Acidobacteriaceae bacterium]
MNIGLLGGTFDPIHHGHFALAKAARDRFELSRVYFVPANVPPHKQWQFVSSYCHRYAMVALATTGEKAFVPSLLEAPEAAGSSSLPGKTRKSETSIGAANYSIDTLRRLKAQLKKSDRLFFLIGIDAFKDIAKWRESEALLRECEFVVASRPGYSLADIASFLPESLRPAAAVTKPFSKQAAIGDLAISGVTIHLLEDVHQNVSATAIRQAVVAKRPLVKFVSPAVSEYIKKMELYRE